MFAYFEFNYFTVQVIQVCMRSFSTSHVYVCIYACVSGEVSIYCSSHTHFLPNKQTTEINMYVFI